MMNFLTQPKCSFEENLINLLFHKESRREPLVHWLDENDKGTLCRVSKLLFQYSTQYFERFASSSETKKRFFEGEQDYYLEKKSIAYFCKWNNHRHLFRNKNSLNKKIETVFFFKVSFLVKMIKENYPHFSDYFRKHNNGINFVLIDDRIYENDQLKSELMKVISKVRLSSTLFENPLRYLDPYLKENLEKKVDALKHRLIRLQRELETISLVECKLRSEKRKEIITAQEEIVSQKLNLTKLERDITDKYMTENKLARLQERSLCSEIQASKLNMDKENRWIDGFCENRFCVHQNLKRLPNSARLMINDLNVALPGYFRNLSEVSIALKSREEDIPEAIQRKLSDSKIRPMLENNIKKNTVNSLLNPKSAIHIESLMDCLNVLFLKNREFVLSHYPLIINGSYVFKKEFPIAPDNPFLIIIPVIVVNEIPMRFAVICVDRANRTIEFYDPWARPFHHPIFIELAYYYFPSQLKETGVQDEETVRIKFNQKKGSLPLHPAIYCYAFCRERLKERSFEEIEENPISSMEMLGLKYELVEKIRGFDY